MPYTLKTQQISVKDPDSGEYIGVDVLAEQNKESLIAEIQSEGDLQVERVDQKAAEILAAGDAQVTRINQTGTNVQTLVNQEEARAQQIVSDAQTSLNTLEAQKNTIAETVASMAELGTDTTLTTPGMAADAKATGDEFSNVKNAISEVYGETNNKYRGALTANTFILTAGSTPGAIYTDTTDKYAANDYYFPVEPNKKYTLSYKTSLPFACGGKVVFYDANKAYVGNESIATNTTNLNYKTFTAGSTVHFMRFYLQSAGNADEMEDLVDWMFNEGDPIPYVKPYSWIIPVGDVQVINNKGTNDSSYDLINPAVEPYLDEVTYDSSDYSYTDIADYSKPYTWYNASWPNPIMIKWTPVENIIRQMVIVSPHSGIENADSITFDVPIGVSKYAINNLIPNTDYICVIKAITAVGEVVTLVSFTFHTANKPLRDIYAEGIINVRDLGGWGAQNSSKIKYGKLYRGAEFNDTGAGYDLAGQGRIELVDRVKIRQELDLRSSPYALSQSALGSKVSYVNYPIGAYAEAFNEGTNANNLVSCFNLISQNLTNGKSTYFHCQGGRDRTGTLAWLIEGLCGVSESDMAKDYELTEFSNPSRGNAAPATTRTVTGFVGLVNYIKNNYTGDTLQAKIRNALIAIGVSTDVLDNIVSKLTA